MFEGGHFLFPQDGQRVVQGSHTGHAQFSGIVFGYPADLIDVKNTKLACKFCLRLGLILCLELRLV